VLSTASKSKPSANDKAPPPRYAAKPITIMKPSSAQNQKPFDGRWRKWIAAAMAVLNGIRPVTTAACIESTSRSARLRKSGKPTTVPRADVASVGKWRAFTIGALVKNK